MTLHKPIACRCRHHLNREFDAMAQAASVGPLAAVTRSLRAFGLWQSVGVSGVHGVWGTTVGNVKLKGIHGFHRNDADRRFVTEVKAWA